MDKADNADCSWGRAARIPYQVRLPHRRSQTPLRLSRAAEVPKSNLVPYSANARVARNWPKCRAEAIIGRLDTPSESVACPFAVNRSPHAHSIYFPRLAPRHAHLRAGDEAADHRRRLGHPARRQSGALPRRFAARLHDQQLRHAGEQEQRGHLAQRSRGGYDALVDDELGVGHVAGVQSRRDKHRVRFQARRRQGRAALYDFHARGRSATPDGGALRGVAAEIPARRQAHRFRHDRDLRLRNAGEPENRARHAREETRQGEGHRGSDLSLLGRLARRRRAIAFVHGRDRERQADRPLVRLARPVRSWW